MSIFGKPSIQMGPITFDQIDVSRVSIPMREPFRISSGAVQRKIVSLIRISSDGSFGWGESSAMPGPFYSTETPESCETELLSTVLPCLASCSFASIFELEKVLCDLTPSPFVRVAIETAAWELLARKENQPLSTLFGFSPRPVPSGLAIGLYDTVDELLQAIERYRVRDYKRLKIKIKRGKDIDLVLAVRQKLGDFPLFVDANADYGPADLGLFREMDRLGLMMFEQPFAKTDLETAAELQRSVQTPICLDESIETAADARRAIELGACRIVNIKLQRVGGYLEALRIAEVCAKHGLKLWMGTMPELGIGSAQALMLAQHPNFTLPTDVELSERWYEDDLLAPRLALNNGCLSAPDGPGIGFTVDPTCLAKYTEAHWQF
jgi:o-succinylbenzoate synthase